MTDQNRPSSARVRVGLVSPSADLQDVHVGEHLKKPLFDWCLERDLRTNGDDSDALSERGTMMCVSLRIACEGVKDLREKVQDEPDLLLDMVDWLVREHLGEAAEYFGLGFDWSELANFDRPLDYLEGLLHMGGSGWRVDRDLPGLSQRVSFGEQEELAHAVSEDDQAGKYLREAWAAAWGLAPDGERAHDRAIKALEAAFRPVVSPRNPDASLSRVADYIRQKPSKWTARLEDARSGSNSGRISDAGVHLIENVARTVFAGNHRHADDGEQPSNTLDDGRDAVALAVALIAMQRRRFLEIRRTDSQDADQTPLEALG